MNITNCTIYAMYRCIINSIEKRQVAAIQLREHNQLYHRSMVRLIMFTILCLFLCIYCINEPLNKRSSASSNAYETYKPT